jgi:AcrR family transcriptional regulator
MPAAAVTTRERILDAAVAEFSEHGLAGARVDRIAAAASANKRAIYEHFGDKERLFDAALHVVLGSVAVAVPLTEDDLPGYAGRLFDHFVANPHAVRMNQWRMLERPDADPEAAAHYEEKVAALGAGSGVLGPVDLVVLVGGLAVAWFSAPERMLGADGSDPRSAARLAAHRAAVVEAATRIVG